MQFEDKIIFSKKIDRNLLYLYDTLMTLDYYTLPKEIETRIIEFRNDVGNLIFDSFPKGYDLVKEDCYFISTFERPNINK